MRQYSLVFKARQDYLEEDYITTSSNAAVASIVLNFPKNWGVPPYSKALLIIGPKASGKTHLAHIWAKKTGAEFINSPCHPNALSDSLSLLDYNKNNFVIDDIENYPAEDLFHLFNHAHAEGKYILMTSSTKPDFSLPDLQSRLNSINTLYLDLPDEQLVKILLIKGFSNRSIKINIEVVDYLVTRIDRDFYTIKMIIEELDKIALSNKRRITIPLVKDFLALR